MQLNFLFKKNVIFALLNYVNLYVVSESLCSTNTFVSKPLFNKYMENYASVL